MTLIFNRDERFSRPSARPPETETIEGTRVLAPKDPEGGGTWIAANEYGLVCCLMNNYSASFTNEPEKQYRSRGLLVRSVSAFSDLHCLRAMLDGIDFREYRPFHLIVFPGVFSPLEWQWDGAELREVVAPPPILTTSGSLPRLTKKLRTRLFRKATDNFTRLIPDEEQLAMHRSRRPWPPAWSVAMKRKNRGTVSLTRVQVNEKDVVMSYQPGDPAATPHPMQISRLERTGSTKPDRELLPCDPYPDHSIDVIRLLGEKNPEMQKKLPGAVRSGIRLVAKEKSINTLLDRHHDLHCNFHASKALNHLGVRAFLKPAGGALPAPETRPVFMSNHPTGGLDGLLVLHWLSTYYPRVHLLVNDLLWNLPHMRPYIIPVDVFGDTRKALKTVFEAFKGDASLMVFPSGVTARKKNGILTEAPWQKNSIKMAIKHKRTVVPIHIDGHNSRFFYGLAWMRKMLRIPMNLEMMLLSWELFKPATKDYGMTVGTPLSPDQVRALGSNDDKRAEQLRRICVQLGEPA